MRVSIYRKAHFNAAHRLHNDNWSDEKNAQVFGKCNNANYHGHNYDLEVKLSGEINQETGYLYDLHDLAVLIKEQIEDRFDHKNLNLDVAEFKDRMPSTENLAEVIWSILRKHLDDKYDISVRLWETPRNSAEYPG